MNKTAKIGFDNEIYLHEQSEAILERVKKFNNKLYLEMGGKILYDYHAARVLPGFDPNAKIRLLQKLKEHIEVILCVHAGDLERNKVRADFGITYDVDAFKSIDDMKWFGINVTAVVVTRFKDQPAAVTFKNKLRQKGIKVYVHYPTKGYPSDVETIVSDEGYGANEYIETSKPIVVVTGPGSGSGKLATSLSNMYHDFKRGIQTGYAKFETFPVWDLSLSNYVNVAYEAATADLRDRILHDPYHEKAYGIKAVSYNRDVEAFDLLQNILRKITGSESPYRSPTDMGVNRISKGIVDMEVVQEAAYQEVIRRHFRSSVEYTMGLTGKTTYDRTTDIMDRIGAKVADRKVVAAARTAAEEAEKEGKGYGGIFSGAAIELRDGTIITGKSSQLLHSAAAMILNATKYLAGLPDEMLLLPESIIDSVTHLKKDILNGKQVSLDIEETLIALAISAISNPAAKMAMEKLTELYGCEMHSTHIPTPGDEAGCRKLKVNLTCDPVFSSNRLFVSE